MDAIQKMQYLLETFEIGSVYHDTTMNLLRNLPRLKSMSIVQVADMCCVSQPTISRLVKRLGFESFSSFKVAVTESLIRHETGQFDCSLCFENLDTDLSVYLDTVKSNIMGALRPYSLQQFSAAAAILHARKRITFDTYSIQPTTCFVSKMLMDGKHVNIIHVQASELAFSNTADADDAVIAFIGGNENWPYKRPIFDAIQARGAKIIAISNEADFSMGNSIDFLFKYNGNVPGADTFFRDLYLRILLGEYQKLK